MWKTTKSFACNCPESFRANICCHIIAVQLQQKLITVPEMLPVTRKRGRPKISFGHPLEFFCLFLLIFSTKKKKRRRNQVKLKEDQRIYKFSSKF